MEMMMYFTALAVLGMSMAVTIARMLRKKQAERVLSVICAALALTALVVIVPLYLMWKS